MVAREARHAGQARQAGPAARRANLLVEIGVEELPPRALQTLGAAFAAELARGLAEAGVIGDQPDSQRFFATPRRLAALVYDVLARQPEHVVERRGPSLSVAYDAHGRPTPAAEGFAKSCGAAVAHLETLNNAQGAWLVHRQKVAGLPLAELLTRCLEDAVRRLPVAKSMRWGAHRAEFVRPVHWLLALHGTRRVKTRVLGLEAGRFTWGHRFHAGARLPVAAADAYAAVLESEGTVIADFDRRRAAIQKQLAVLSRKAGARVKVDDALLDLVTGMVEWPRALLGDFDRRFLKLPPEVLVSCMRVHQKYFHLADDHGKLLPGFITVSNIKSKTPARVRRGNERVLRARLTDAEFFWNSDLKTPLESRVDGLRGVRFHTRLGSLHDKSVRVAHLARRIAGQLGGDSSMAERAALLCKADLVTDMVGEFPELQGIMGRHYAKKSGQAGAVAEAVEQHHWPRHAGDKLPSGALAQSVAVADRIDSLMGLFAAGEAPTGDKDPFALRRAALGVLRILIEKQLDLDLRELLRAGRESYAATGTTGIDNAVLPDAQTDEQVFAFMLERLRAYYQSMGYRASELASVMACQPTRPLDFHRRLRALSRFFADRPAAAASLASANKRIAGILGKAGRSARTTSEVYDPSLLQEPAETDLARQLDRVGVRVRAYFDGNRYDKGFAALAKLKQPVDAFFDEVMVMAPDPAIRNNRLALLTHLRELFLGVADISVMDAERRAPNAER